MNWFTRLKEAVAGSQETIVDEQPVREAAGS